GEGGGGGYGVGGAEGGGGRGRAAAPPRGGDRVHDCAGEASRCRPCVVRRAREGGGGGRAGDDGARVARDGGRRRRDDAPQRRLPRDVRDRDRRLDVAQAGGGREGGARARRAGRRRFLRREALRRAVLGGHRALARAATRGAVRVGRGLVRPDARRVVLRATHSRPKRRGEAIDRELRHVPRARERDAVTAQVSPADAVVHELGELDEREVFP